MQGGQEPGRGVYVARRVVAVLVILLLLLLLVPRACQALFGSEESSTQVPETSSVGGLPGGEETTVPGGEETATEENTVRVTEIIIIREVPPDGTGDGVKAVGNESGETLNVGAAENPTGMGAGLEAVVGGSGISGTNQTAPVPNIGTGNQQQQQQQQQVQPVAFEEPVVFEEPTFSGETTFSGEPMPFQEPNFFEAPVPSGKPVAFGVAGDATTATTQGTAVASVGGGGGAVASVGGGGGAVAVAGAAVASS